MMRPISATRSKEGPKPSMRCVAFDSENSRLQGVFFQWAGLGPRPTLLLLHGIPGAEQNIDIARAVHRKRWNSLVFHYRGCCGSEGAYSIPGILDDAAAAARFLRDQENVDPGRLAVAGLSLGGWATIAFASGDSGFKSVVAMAPLPGPEAMEGNLRIEDLQEYSGHLSGTTPDKLRLELGQVEPIAAFAERLRDRKLLLLTADKDELFAPESYADFQRAAPWAEWRRFPRADHAFLIGREKLVRTIVPWLVKSMD
jgi:uncharacterized protein